MPSDKTLVRVGLILLAGLALAAFAPPVHGQETGRVSGRAVAAETGTPLEGARVTVQGTAISAVTDLNGRYLLPLVPVGSQVIQLSYIGRAAQTAPVEVTAGGTATADFSAPLFVARIEELRVIGARAMTQAEALNRQKNAVNIMNVVASDQIGRFPDASAPEAVQRLPGVSVARDQGEGRYIQIRGGSAANTQVSFNGVQIPSPEGEARQIALDAVPVDILESIEVSKALLPNMDADAIGGAVNLVTRRAPVARLLSAEFAGGLAPLRSGASGSGALTFGSRSTDGRFGFLLNGSYSRRNFGSDDVEPVWEVEDPGLADDVLEEMEVRHYTLWRSRLGANVTLDYQASPSTRYTLTGIYSELQDQEQRRNLVYLFEDDELEYLHKNRLEKLRMFSLAATGEHGLGRRGKLDYTLAFTRSLEHTPFDAEIAFVQEDVSFAPDISDVNRIRPNPQAGALAGPFLFDEIEPANSDTRDRDLVGALNLSLPFRLGRGTGTLQLGGKLRDKRKDQRLLEESYELAGGAPDIRLGQGIGGPFSGYLRYPARYDLPAAVTQPDEVTGFINRYAGSLEGETAEDAATNNYDLKERVAAGYAMLSLDLTPALTLVPGVRYEHTKVTTEGFDWDSEEETLTPVTGASSYGRLFPMVHARLALSSRTNLRAAFTTAIARPNFYDLVPYRLRDDEDLALGNPDLAPMTSRNFDLLLEHYDDRIGVLSAGVFYKRLTDPIFVFREDNTLGGETEQPRNAESGWIRGFEVALQRQLRFLPRPLDGLGIYANYTFTDSEATLPGGRVAPLQGQADQVYNLALSYERGGFSGQLSLNYHAAFVDEYGGDEGDPDERFEDAYIDQHRQIDFSASYRFRARSTLFLELVNLTNEPLRAYLGVTERPIQLEYYRPWGRLGMRLTW